MTHTHTNTTRRRGAAMMELVLVLPLILVVLALLFYLGRLETRTQRTQVMVRYEAWRAAAGAPGPNRDEPRGNLTLDRTFHTGGASRIEGTDFGDSYFESGGSLDAFDEFVRGGEQYSEYAGTMNEAFAWVPGRVGSDARNSNSVNRAFNVWHEDAVADWARVASVWSNEENMARTNPGEDAIHRRHYRTAGDWSHTENWRASAHRWQRVGGSGEIHTLRAMRDSFYLDFDGSLDGVDGETSTEYNGRNVQIPGDNLAGQVRKMYLQPVGYRGPDLGVSNDEDADPI